ncbi:MAG: hypothetical protein AAFN79_12215 [Pseudomonadota bacterium]
MDGASDLERNKPETIRSGFCLTGMSLASLLGCALGASAALWLCILAVL